MPTLVEQNQVLDLIRRLNPSGDGVRLVPGEALPYVSRLRVVSQSGIFGAVNVVLTWQAPEDPFQQISFYRVFAKNNINRNAVPTLLAETFTAPAQVQVTTDGTLPVVFLVQCVFRSGQVNPLDECPTTTATVAAPTVGQTDLNFPLVDGYQPQQLIGTNYSLNGSGLVGGISIGGPGTLLNVGAVFTGVGNTVTGTVTIQLSISIDGQTAQTIDLATISGAGPVWASDIQAIAETSGTLSGGTAWVRIPFPNPFLATGGLSLAMIGGSFPSANGSVRLVVQYATKI